MHTLANVLSLALAAACGSPTASGAPRTLPPGSWGGDHVALQVTAEGATIEFDCAHGSIDGPLALDDAGRFESPGTYVREHGGPIREGAEEATPARYAGRVEDRTMTLAITLSGSEETLGPFRLERGRTPRLTKCL